MCLCMWVCKLMHVFNAIVLPNPTCCILERITKEIWKCCLKKDKVKPCPFCLSVWTCIDLVLQVLQSLHWKTKTVPQLSIVPSTQYPDHNLEQSFHYPAKRNRMFVQEVKAYCDLCTKLQQTKQLNLFTKRICPRRRRLNNLNPWQF